jgi:tRNA A-37 threonylcarbamoyl transferase component Bud32
VICLRRDGVRWHCEEQFVPQLEVLLLDKGRTTRQSHAKLITVHEVNGVRFFKKHYVNSAVVGRPFKYWFKPSPARREWRLAREIARRGVPVVRHLAYGERWSWRGLEESILITEGFDGQPLVEAAGRQSDAVQAALGRFLRQHHDHGVLQRDLQRNILVHPATGELRRVDVQHARLLRTVTEDQRRANLALLNATVPLSDMFFRAYGWTPAQAHATRLLSEAIRRARVHSRSKRCLKRNSEFAPRRFGRLRWHVRLKFLDEHLRGVLTDPDGFLATRAHLFKGPERSSTVGSAGGVVVKRFNLRKPANLLKDLFRPSRALRAFRKAYHLETLGLPTPRPLAAAEQRVLRCLLRSYLVTEEVPGARDLGRYLARVPRVESAVVRQLAELVGRLHAEGFSHRDLKETNLLLDPAGRVYLIDLDGLAFLRRVSDERAAADLARLARAVASFSSVTDADRAAFLRHYCRVRQVRRLPWLRRGFAAEAAGRERRVKS